MSKQPTQNGNEHVSLKLIARGLFVSYIITIPLFAVFALVLSWTGFPDRLMKPAVVITTITSILLAGITTTRTLKNRGWFNGGMVGFIYMLVLYILSSIVYDDFTIDRYVTTMTVIGVLTGAIGGIVGINSNTGRRGRRRIKNY